MRVLCDWGSSRLRAFLEVDGEVLEHAEGPGIARAGGDLAWAALERVVRPWRARGSIERIVICGMGGSRNGVVEVPYLRAPVSAAQWRAGAQQVRWGQDTLTVLPGIQAQNFRDAADVMRGEEAQIFGALSLEPTLGTGRHMLVLPGTHSKWVEVREGRIARLHTYVTGELFELLSTRSSLMRVGGQAVEQEEEDAFDVGVRNAARSDLGASLFETRSAQLIEGRSGQWARSLLSGLLIGAEVHGMLSRGVAESVASTLIGDAGLTERYERAFELYGSVARRLDGQRCVRAGVSTAGRAEQER